MAPWVQVNIMARWHYLFCEIMYFLSKSKIKVCINYHKVMQHLNFVLKLLAKFVTLRHFQRHTMRVAQAAGLVLSELSVILAPVLVVCFCFLIIQISLCLLKCLDKSPPGGETEYEKSVQYYRDI